jgi:hypothetical protein
MNGLVAHRGAQLMSRQDLLAITTPEPTDTHRPIPHASVIEALIQALGFRNITVLSGEDKYAVTPDGMRMFGVLPIVQAGDSDHDAIRLTLGVRNSHDKTFSLAFTVGYKVFVCDNLAFYGDFTPVTRKHSKNVDYVEVVDGAVAKMQRHFEPMKKQIDAWRDHSLPDNEARLIIYRAFIEERLEAPKHLARTVHWNYFEPQFEDFRPRTLWSLSNAFTLAFKELEPVSTFKATARLGDFLGQI